MAATEAVDVGFGGRGGEGTVSRHHARGSHFQPQLSRLPATAIAAAAALELKTSGPRRTRWSTAQAWADHQFCDHIGSSV